MLNNLDLTEAGKIMGATALSMAGGLVRIFMRHPQKKIGWRGVLREMFISGFAGLMIFYLIGGYFVDGYMVSFLCGMAGYTAPYTLDFLSHKFREMAKGKKK